MGGIFGIDSPVMNFLSAVADIFLLSILWLIFSLPIVTMGAATTAVYYVAINRLSNREGYVLKGFWKSFKMNFKQSTIVHLILMALLVVIALNIYSLNYIIEFNGFFKSLLFGVQFLLLIEIAFVNIYIYGIISKFEMNLKETFKLAFLLAHKHLFTTITILVSIGILFFVLYYLNSFLFLIVLPALIIFVTSFFLLMVFKKYTDAFNG